ncbi:MAG: permease [Myxococcales bacterium]|nr:permease [Myxococcales bacterium]
MWLLLVGVAALFAGPLLSQIARKDGRIVHGIDGFVLVAMGGLVLLHLLPHSFEQGGQLAMWAALLGLGLPLAVHRVLHGGDHGHDHSDGGVREEPEPWLLLLVAGLALLVHAIIDGSALGGAAMTGELHHHGLDVHDHAGHDHAGHDHAGHDHAGHAAHDTHGAALPLLGLAVVLHRLPIGIALWWALAPRFGVGVALGTLIAMAGATVAGFFASDLFAAGLAAMSVFEAFVAGALLHVIFHTHVAEPQNEPCGDSGIFGDSHTRASAVGGALGLATLFVVGGTHPTTETAHLAATETFIALLLAIAPILLVALVGAGLLHVGLMNRLSPPSALSRGRLMGALRGVGLGVLLPLKPCGVPSLHDTMTQRGVAPPLALALLAAAPAFGIDALLVSLPLLGVDLTLYRLGAVVVVALLAAVVAGWMGRRDVDAQAVADVVPEDALAPAGLSSSLAELARRALRFGLIDLFDAVIPWVVVGLVIAAMAEPMLEISLDGHAGVILLAILGLPLYFCATGATPIAMILVHKGLSPGAAIAWLVTVSSASVPAAKSVANRHGKGVAVAFIATVFLSAVAVGLLIDHLEPQTNIAQLHALGGGSNHWVHVGATILLGAAAAVALLRRGPRGLIDKVVAAHGPNHEHSHHDTHAHHDHTDDSHPSHHHAKEGHHG